MSRQRKYKKLFGNRWKSAVLDQLNDWHISKLFDLYLIDFKQPKGTWKLLSSCICEKRCIETFKIQYPFIDKNRKRFKVYVEYVTEWLEFITTHYRLWSYLSRRVKRCLIAYFIMLLFYFSKLTNKPIKLKIRS